MIIITKVVNGRVAKYLKVTQEEDVNEILISILKNYPEAFIYDGEYSPEIFSKDGKVNLVAIEIPFEIKLEEVRNALQSAIDIKARSFGFSSGNALMLYAGFANQFQPLAQVFATWEASVWVEADAYKQEVIAGTKPMLSGAEAVALMPIYPS